MQKLVLPGNQAPDLEYAKFELSLMDKADRREFFESAFTIGLILLAVLLIGSWLLALLEVVAEGLAAFGWANILATFFTLSFFAFAFFLIGVKFRTGIGGLRNEKWSLIPPALTFVAVMSFLWSVVLVFKFGTIISDSGFLIDNHWRWLVIATFCAACVSPYVSPQYEFQQNFFSWKLGRKYIRSTLNFHRHRMIDECVPEHLIPKYLNAHKQRLRRRQQLIRRYGHSLGEDMYRKEFGMKTHKSVSQTTPSPKALPVPKNDYCKEWMDIICQRVRHEQMAISGLFLDTEHVRSSAHLVRLWNQLSEKDKARKPQVMDPSASTIVQENWDWLKTAFSESSSKNKPSATKPKLTLGGDALDRSPYARLMKDVYGNDSSTVFGDALDSSPYARLTQARYSSGDTEEFGVSDAKPINPVNYGRKDRSVPPVTKPIELPTPAARLSDEELAHEFISNIRRWNWGPDQAGVSEATKSLLDAAGNYDTALSALNAAESIGSAPEQFALMKALVEGRIYKLKAAGNS